jgi:hypothetical protein
LSIGWPYQAPPGFQVWSARDQVATRRTSTFGFFS